MSCLVPPVHCSGPPPLLFVLNLAKRKELVQEEEQEDGSVLERKDKGFAFPTGGTTVTIFNVLATTQIG